jgi:hypothetical protein
VTRSGGASQGAGAVSVSAISGQRPTYIQLASCSDPWKGRMRGPKASVEHVVPVTGCRTFFPFPFPFFFLFFPFFFQFSFLFLAKSPRRSRSFHFFRCFFGMCKQKQQPKHVLQQRKTPCLYAYRHPKLHTSVAAPSTYSLVPCVCRHPAPCLVKRVLTSPNPSLRLIPSPDTATARASLQSAAPQQSWRNDGARSRPADT